MNYDNKFNKQWQNEGTEPADSFFTSTGGFKAKLKPPAQYFNWFWHKVIAAITELQTKLSTVNTNVDGKAEKNNSSGGFDGGNNASSTTGGAVGKDSYTTTGGAVGKGSISKDGGGSIGSDSWAGAGFSGGKNAQVALDGGDFIDAIQLGTGKNSEEKSLQVYSYQLMDGSGNIPVERLNNVGVYFLKFPTITLNAQSTKDFVTDIVITPQDFMLIRLREGNTAGLTYVSGVSYYTYTGSNFAVQFNSNGTIHFSNSSTSSVTITNLEFLVIRKNPLTVN